MAVISLLRCIICAIIYRLIYINMPEDKTKIQIGLQNINQDFKEKDVQERAKIMGISYVKLLNIPLNPDYGRMISKEDSVVSGIVIFFKSGKDIKLAVIDPTNEKTKEFISIFEEKEYKVTINLCSEESLRYAQDIYYANEHQNKKGKTNAFNESDLASFADEIKNLEDIKEKIEHSTYDVALNYIQVGGYKTHSSDIHFQPEQNGVLVRFRIDGILKPVFTLTHDIYDGITKQVKQLSSLKLNIVNSPQDGQYSFLINKRKINVRVSYLPSKYGESCVMRLLDSQKTFSDFEELGFEGLALKNIKKGAQLPHGMILVTGPTGSGKTTTMYSMLQSIDIQKEKVITLEDPIEYDLSGITQSQVDSYAKYDFATGLRAVLRQDPDIIMIGEIRDLETAEVAAQASLTGHLVISTLHTNSALESIPRLINMGLKSYILAPSLELIIAQRLVRKVCPHCKKTRKATLPEQKQIEIVLEIVKSKNIEAPAVPTEITYGEGCDKCAGTGYLGQIVISEVLRFTEDLRALILADEPISKIRHHLNQHSKMLSLQEDGIMKVIKGVTTLEEVYRVTV